MTTPITADLTAIRERWAAVRQRVIDAASIVGRDPADIDVLVATKTQPVEAVRAVIDAGARLIGENRVQELLTKTPGLADLAGSGAVNIHLIGTLQRNKINAVLAGGAVSCVQSIDTAVLAEALSRRCLASGRELNVMVQVNVSGESTKSGVTPDDAAQLARHVAALPGLQLHGFMTIGARSSDERVVRAGFARLRAVRDQVAGPGEPGTQTATALSMGMSSDLEWAIAEGATLVRVGSAIFGSRN